MGGSRKSHLSSSSSSTSTSNPTSVPPAQTHDTLSAARLNARDLQFGSRSELDSQQSLRQGSSSLSSAASHPDLLFTSGAKSFGSASEDHHSDSQQRDDIVEIGAEDTQHLGQVLTEGFPEAVGDMSWPFSSNAIAPPGPGSRIVSWGGDWWDRCLSTFGPRPRR